jgi:ATPase subunit of ABC transporter with duplicated ATPase domains
LQEFTGTLLVVSHDRYFLDHLVRRIIDLDGGTVREYPGNFSDFFRQKYPVLPRMSTRLQDRGKVRKAGAEDRISLGVEELERRIEVLEREKTGLDKELIRCYQNRDATGGRELVRKLEKVQKRLDGLYDEWEKELR